jgi:hypothetical protein
MCILYLYIFVCKLLLLVLPCYHFFAIQGLISELEKMKFLNEL